MTNRILLISVLCLQFSAFVHSQTMTLSGTIRDSSTLAALDSATIVIINRSNPSEQYQLSSNSFGQWSQTFQLASVDDGYSLPLSFNLEQNFPNPFNPSTKIRFQLAQAGTVILRVHNILGQELDAKSFSLPSGEHIIDWHSKGSAGALFYSIEMNGSRITKKMIQLDGGFGTGFGSVSTSRSIHVVPSLPKNQSAEYTVIISKLGYESDSSIVVLTGNVQHDRQLPLVHFHSFVIDLHNDVLEKVIVGYQIAIRHTTDHSDLPRMLEGGLDAQMFVSWPDPTKNIRNWHTATLAMIDSFKNIVTANSNIIAHARSVKEIQDANAAGKIAGILCVEGGHAIDSSLENLKDFYAKGARYFTITWNNSIGWAISAQDPLSATQGLNGFGRQVIQLMDSLGMIIDVAHTGIKTIEDILAVTKNPIIDSHAGARALRDHYRNLTDDQIRKIAAKGGVIGVVFYPSFISSVSRATIDTVIKHIDYIKNLVGIDYVAIGSDYDGMESAPAGLEDVSKLPNLTMALLKHGYSIPEVRKILGGNYMRVFQQVCK